MRAIRDDCPWYIQGFILFWFVIQKKIRNSGELSENCKQK